jgi:hypothetical protein
VRFGADALTEGVETHRIEGETVRVSDLFVLSSGEVRSYARNGDHSGAQDCDPAAGERQLQVDRSQPIAIIVFTQSSGR